MKQPFSTAICCLGIMVSCQIAVGQPAARVTGRFYIVGMGTAPDLITVRAQKVIASADVVLTEEGPASAGWPELVRGKEVWHWPHTFRRYYGLDPGTLRDPAQRAVFVYAAILPHGLIG